MISDASPVKSHFKAIEETIELAADPVQCGKVIRITGMKVEITGVDLPIGATCKIQLNPEKYIDAEVVGFSGEMTYLMPVEDVSGIKQGALVMPVLRPVNIKVGAQLLGRVIDSMGNPLDNLGEVVSDDICVLHPKNINPLQRKRIRQPLDVGVKAINTLLTIGKGQRMGIFACSGVGKSVLIGMMTKFTSADVVVVGLIGERGREVKEFIEEILGPEGLKKTVVVASPADTSPLMRVNGAVTATAIAEYYRDQGKDVLLIIDSLTRYAQAQREITLSLGELPTSKGYTPSVFAKISKLIERSGNSREEQGSITAFYTVLVEREDEMDIIGEHAKSILDGHIVLSAQLANQGHFPAIDIERSISRVMNSIIDDRLLKYTNYFKKLHSIYQRNVDLISIGAYKSGSDASIDLSIKLHEAFNQYLCQSMNECVNLEESFRGLLVLLNDHVTD